MNEASTSSNNAKTARNDDRIGTSVWRTGGGNQDTSSATDQKSTTQLQDVICSGSLSDATEGVRKHLSIPKRVKQSVDSIKNHAMLSLMMSVGNDEDFKIDSYPFHAQCASTTS